MEEKEKKTEIDEKALKKNRKALPLAVLVVLALCVCGWFYHRNTPLQRQLRILEQADRLLEAQEYEQAAEEYVRALEIEADGAQGEETAARARQGRIRAVLLQADSLAAQTDIAVRAGACDLYEQVITLCEENEEDTAVRQETAQKLAHLRQEMASSFDAVACTTARDDRSGTTVLSDGQQVSYVRYYDLVQVTEEYYPYADRINEVLVQDGNTFFANGSDPAAGSSAPEGEFRDYVGEAGIYSGSGLLSIRLAEVRMQGKTQSVFFRGRTFRLSDGGEITLAELTERTDTGLRRLVRQSLAAYLEEQGYKNISRADIERYIMETAPEDFKYCIRDTGEICLVIDQEVPFFRNADTVLEIPLGAL